MLKCVFITFTNPICTECNYENDKGLVLLLASLRVRPLLLKFRILSETWGHWTESLQEMRFLGPLQNIFISSCRRNNMVAIWAILVSFLSTETLNKISETTSRNNLIDTNNVGDIFHSIFSFRMETINNIFHVPFSLFLINKI